MHPTDSGDGDDVAAARRERRRRGRTPHRGIFARARSPPRLLLQTPLRPHGSDWRVRLPLALPPRYGRSTEVLPVPPFWRGPYSRRRREDCLAGTVPGARRLRLRAAAAPRRRGTTGRAAPRSPPRRDRRRHRSASASLRRRTRRAPPAPARPRPFPSPRWPRPRSPPARPTKPPGRWPRSPALALASSRTPTREGGLLRPAAALRLPFPWLRPPPSLRRQPPSARPKSPPQLQPQSRRRLPRSR
mmetsp:Transcript_21305/g.62001  ORF Transcript_21305/g.62001 Transcript_21305/m.62001 type:complete len:245 (-) Transcript_21305:16-750(-)